MDIDITGLDSRVFTAFAETSNRRYVYLCNLNTDVSRWSKNAVEYFGLPGEFMLHAGGIWEEHIHPDDREAYCRDINAIFSGEKDFHNMEYRVRNKEGDYVACTCKGMVMKGENGEPDLFAGSILNHGIADNFDTVTNLKNGFAFMQDLASFPKTSKNSYVLMVGINQFNNINYLYGYLFGNKVLREFGVQLCCLCGAGISLYRMEGSRFALLIQNTTVEQIQDFYEQIRDMAHKKIFVEGTHILLTVSGGVVRVNGEGVDEYSIRSCATYALNKSKNAIQGNLFFFDKEFQNSSAKSLELLNAIRQSVISNCKGFYLCYQPLVDAVTGEIIGMESLLRWKSDIFGEVPPGKFIPVLENDPCFYILGLWILKTAMQEGKPIIQDHPDFIVNVNISYSQLERAEFCNTVIALLEETEFPPQNLCLELTERCHGLDIDHLRDAMNFLREHKIKIALDDFGTGTSSLSLVCELPIDCLKMDQTFISNIMNSRTDQVIVETMVQCANTLGIQVCLEGVENETVRDFVLKYNAEEHQGFYYSRPVRIEKIMELLN